MAKKKAKEEGHEEEGHEEEGHEEEGHQKEGHEEGHQKEGRKEALASAFTLKKGASMPPFFCCCPASALTPFKTGSHRPTREPCGSYRVVRSGRPRPFPPRHEQTPYTGHPDAAAGSE